MEAPALLYARFLVAGSPFRGRGGLLGVLGWKWGGVGVPVRRGSARKWSEAMYSYCSSLRRKYEGAMKAKPKLEFDKTNIQATRDLTYAKI